MPFQTLFNPISSPACHLRKDRTHDQPPGLNQCYSVPGKRRWPLRWEQPCIRRSSRKENGSFGDERCMQEWRTPIGWDLRIWFQMERKASPRWFMKPKRLATPLEEPSFTSGDEGNIWFPETFQPLTTFRKGPKGHGGNGDDQIWTGNLLIMSQTR